MRETSGRRLTGVGHADLIALVRVQPDLALAALEHFRRKALLQQQRDAHAACRGEMKRHRRVNTEASQPA